MKHSEFLELAADVIETGGLAKGYAGSVIDKGVPHCIIGAMFFVEYNYLPPYGTYGRIRTLLEDKVNTSLPKWNDHPDRTKKDVINLLKETAREVENL